MSSIPSPKILLRSPNWVGDAIMATPVARALKKSMPHCTIHVLARPWVAPVWERNPDVDRILSLEPKKKSSFRKWLKLLSGLRRERYDLAVVLPNSFSAAWLAWCAGCKQRVGYATDQRGWLLNRRVSWKKAARHLPRPQAYLNLARAAGADVDLCKEWVFTVKVSPEELARAESLLGLAPVSEAAASGMEAGKITLVGLAPGSVAPSRRWPEAYYAGLADRLAAAGCKVVLLGSASDAAAAEAVAAACKTKPLILAGKTSLREMLAVVKRLDLLVSNDSGAMHMAYSQAVPVLVLQGAADAQITGPFGPGSQALRDASMACAPCVRNECQWGDLRCMISLTVDMAWEYVQAMLAPKSAKAVVKNGSAKE